MNEEKKEEYKKNSLRLYSFILDVKLNFSLRKIKKRKKKESEIRGW